MNNCTRIISSRIFLIVVIALVISSTGLLYAQGSVYEVIIPTDVDYTSFPEISFNVIVSNERRGRVAKLQESDFVLSEDGQELPFTLDEFEAGIQVVFVLDASASTRQNGATGYPRLDEGKQVITTFAEEGMVEGVDLVAVLAPESSTTFQKVAPLPDDPSDFTTFRNTVRDGTYLYELPQGVTATPLNDMVSRALTILENDESGRHQAVVVISDGVDVISDRQVSDTVNKANQLNIPIHTVIFGPASNWGGPAESNMKRLSLDTHGEHLQLASEGRRPDPLEELISASMEQLYNNLESQRTQYTVTYSSAVFSSGRHEVELEVGGKSTKTGFSINLRPPAVAITQPQAGDQITRSTDDPSAAVADIEPRTQLVAFDIGWPDGYAREITAIDLLVDGVAVQDTCVPPCNQVTWNIADLSAGSHSVRIRVHDQMGMQAESDEIPVRIDIIIPTPVPPTPTPLPTPTPTPTPVPACEEQYTGVDLVMQCYREEAISGLAVVIALVALILVIILLRRPPRVVSSMVNKVKEMTEPFFLERDQVRGSQPAKAILEVLEGDDSHREPIEIVGENTRLGRDEALAQIVLDDRSVSRLHARITEEEPGHFVLYDEGSTSGSYVNYEPVGIKGQWLQHDDVVNLGRVKLRFKLKSRVVHDATIAMKPIRPGMLDQTVVTQQADKPPEPEPEPVDEFATQPYMAAAPEPEPAPPPSDATQPFLYDSPPPSPPQDDFDDDEGISTEPFVPLDPMDLEG
jgi:hypothetical protein